MTGHRGTGAERERGQILVLFALGLVVIIGMVGLVLDGGDTFAQRRKEQNAADLAALAGANAYLNTNGTVAARTSAAQSAAAAAAGRNGYTNGVNGAVVPTATVTLGQTGAWVTINVTAPHANTFARVLGANSWNVSVTATAETGSVSAAVGAAPWTMNINAFNSDGTPKYGSSNPQRFNTTNDDYATNALDIAWTDFNGANNVNTNEVRGIINGTNVVTATFLDGQYLGQKNNGNHTALYSDVQQYLAGGKPIPVPVTGPGPCNAPQQSALGGCFLGWAMFQVLSASGGSDKYIEGYFTGNFTATPLSVGVCPPNPQSPCGLPDTTSQFDRLKVELTN